MLNVPETVKALFKADGIRKNFRVHFPGGELPDITNESIVQESVKFTESLCSQDVLKFGLTEASVIEFETVGVANMYGMTIEAGIEIDLSSLSAAEIAEIAAGSWDGVYVSETDTDIGFPFFRVPYGVFRVESCPRDHQAMTHRRVQAYSLFGGNNTNNPFEVAKLGLLLPGNTYTPNAYLLALSCIGYQDEDFLPDNGFTKRELPLYNNTSHIMQKAMTLKKTDQSDFPVTFGIEFYSSSIANPRGANAVQFGKLYGADLHGVNYNQVISLVADYLEERGVSYSESGYVSFASIAEDGFTSIQDNVGLACFPALFYRQPPDTYYLERNVLGSARISSSNFALYPLRDDPLGVDFSSGFFVPYKITVLHSGTTYKPLGDFTPATIYEYTPPAGIDQTVLSYISTLASKITISGSQVDAFSFSGIYTPRAIANGYLEMMASFCAPERTGKAKMFRLSSAGTDTVQPGNYTGFWWDEYDVLPIGSIRIAFKDESNNEVVYLYRFGSGASAYDMTDNEMLKALAGASLESIIDLLDENFVPYIGPIAFTPIDLDMKGLPYLEAGDYLAVTAGDGVTAYSFNMRQEISGVQVLEAHVESTSGDIIESGESE